MPTTLGLRLRRRRSKMAVGMPGDNNHILDVARRLREVVEDLIRAIPLDKRIAAGLPKTIRQEFKTLVDAVRAGERSGPARKRF